MADCLSCDKYVDCDNEKVAAHFTSDCEDYVAIDVRSRKAPKLCKYCGNAVNPKSSGLVCERCRNKSVYLPRFVQARDTIRAKMGMPPMCKEDCSYETCKEAHEGATQTD